MKTRVSCLIVACNAEKTIARAIESAMEQVQEIILVDDGSEDSTLAVARSVAGARLSYHKLEYNSGIGSARQAAVAMCNTEFSCWLDADDVWLPGRIARLLPYCEECGADYVFDESELYSGVDGTKEKDLRFPGFLKEPAGLHWQIGRNFIPTIGVPLARTSALKAIGYDRRMRQAEDYEHFLRAFFSGKSIQLVPGKSYREYAYPTSASRNLDVQNVYLRKAYESIRPEYVLEKLNACQLNSYSVLYIKAMYLTRIEDWQRLQKLSESWLKLREQEQRGEEWPAAFFLGVASFRLGVHEDALKYFQSIHSGNNLPEVMNNIGVCKASLGIYAESYFDRALELKPDYMDAFRNKHDKPTFLTVLPLRDWAYRGEYFAGHSP